MALKTYVLLDHLRPTAPISVQVNKDQRVRLDVLPLWEPFLQITSLYYDPIPEIKQGDKIIYQGRPGNENRTIRLKLNSNTVWQDEQIEKEKIPANVPFTPAERNARKFINGVLATNNPQVQRFIEAYPAYDKFNGYCSEVTGPAFKLFDQDIIIKSTNENFKKRLKAANKIAGLDLKGAQDLLIRIYGVAYKPPEDIDLAQNILVDFMDETPEAGIDEILRGDINMDEETQIMIGRLVNAGVLSFEAVQDQVVKKGKDGRWINLKGISDEYTLMERQRYFLEFLTGPDGRLLMRDLKAELAALTAAPKGTLTIKNRGDGETTMASEAVVNGEHAEEMGEEGDYDGGEHLNLDEAGYEVVDGQQETSPPQVKKVKNKPKAPARS